VQIPPEWDAAALKQAEQDHAEMIKVWLRWLGCLRAAPSPPLLRLARRKKAQMDAFLGEAPPPPLVLSGHAASLTPY